MLNYLYSRLFLHYMDYATNFRKLRQRAGHTQESLGMALNLSQTAVYRIENGKRKLDLNLVSAMATAVNQTPEAVLNELNGVTVHSSIQENHGTDVNVTNVEIETIKALYERLLSEKEKYIVWLEERARVEQAA